MTDPDPALTERIAAGKNMTRDELLEASLEPGKVTNEADITIGGKMIRHSARELQRLVGRVKVEHLPSDAPAGPSRKMSSLRNYSRSRRQNSRMKERLAILQDKGLTPEAIREIVKLSGH